MTHSPQAFPAQPGYAGTALQAVRKSLGHPAASEPNGKLLWELFRPASH